MKSYIGLYLYLYLRPLYWACTMTHQVLEEYNSLPTTQTTNRVPQNYCFTTYQVLTTY